MSEAACPTCGQVTFKTLAEREGGPMFMGWPDRWWEAHVRRCENGHVGTCVLRSEGLRRDACLACRAPVHLTFPEDVDGPGPLLACSCEVSNDQ